MLRPGNIDGNASGQKSLIARFPKGILVFKFTPGTTPDTGTWTTLASSGAMADTDCFASGKCWKDAASYYATIQLADIDGTGKATLLGRGDDGLKVYQRNGSGWTKLTGLPALSDPSWTQPQYY
jgi:hypothetical protein